MTMRGVMPAASCDLEQTVTGSSRPGDTPRSQSTPGLAWLREDLALVSWLHSYGDLPDVVGLRLCDALIEWAVLVPDEPVPQPPATGSGTPVGQLLDAVRGRLIGAVAGAPDAATRFALARVGRELALAVRALHELDDPRSGT
jgi:aminoglycoside phosphotransferase